jgi:hypothetical protein
MDIKKLLAWFLNNQNPLPDWAESLQTATPDQIRERVKALSPEQRTEIQVANEAFESENPS